MTLVKRIRSLLVTPKALVTAEQGGEEGFTLVEMLVVITIIGLIMGLIGPRVLNYLSESKVKAARIQLQSFAGALDLFYLDAGRFPPHQKASMRWCTGQLARRHGTVPISKGGFCSERSSGTILTFIARRESMALYDIMSHGSDGQDGGSGVAADISLDKLTSAKND